ncbi:A/G-specific adenine glycosylase [Castellaniella sp.]|uniref:A/G-specific adenine glycosylase n=1 Tax=Castellaniella sp. TaxID=1955812 RepID=UPI002AFDF366|nr:A/G-specific adenine glycosylase [Castellaniella sp.]
MSAGDPASLIAAWQALAGRHDLPWQDTRDAYRIWLSEIMLQQTQANTVIPYFHRFLSRFPDVCSLADAPLDAVLQAWAGLGYYARARNLHRCAQRIRDEHSGQFPAQPETLAQLPGIGRSTAAAIAAFAHGVRVPILDGNVRRVLIRYLALAGDPQSTAMNRRLWAQAQAWLDQAPANLDMQAYTQGQMDLGAMVCTRSRPDCSRCPLLESCAAHRLGQQDSLPSPRPRKAQPQHQVWLLIMEYQQQLWLQRRPDTGVWGGLWTPPLLGSPAALQTVLQGLGQPDTVALAGFEHVFTHFRLTMQPVWLRLPKAAPAIQPSWQQLPAGKGATARNPVLIDLDAGQSSWTPLTALNGLGMPAPVATLLDGLYPAAAAL